MHCVADQLHAGMDFIADRNTPVLIPVDGTVALKSEDTGPGYNRAMRGYGNSVVIRVDRPVPGLPSPFWYSLNHFNAPSPLVVGQRVTAGMQAGVVGNTTNGQFRTMPPHLHFEVRVRPFPGSYDRDTVDPAVLWDGLGIDWMNHSLVGGRQSGGQLLVRRGGPSDCSRSHVSGMRLGLYGLGTDTTHIDPSSPQIKGKYTAKGTSTKSMDEQSPEAEPPEYQEVVPQSSGGGNTLYIALGAAALLVGGAYLLKKKRNRSAVNGLGTRWQDDRDPGWLKQRWLRGEELRTTDPDDLEYLNYLNEQEEYEEAKAPPFRPGFEPRPHYSRKWKKQHGLKGLGADLVTPARWIDGIPWYREPGGTPLGPWVDTGKRRMRGRVEVGIYSRPSIGADGYETTTVIAVPLDQTDQLRRMGLAA